MKHGTIIRLRYCKREDASKPIYRSERRGFGYRERRIINNKENLFYARMQKIRVQPNQKILSL